MVSMDENLLWLLLSEIDVLLYRLNLSLKETNNGQAKDKLLQLVASLTAEKSALKNQLHFCICHQHTLPIEQLGSSIDECTSDAKIVIKEATNFLQMENFKSEKQHLPRKDDALTLRVVNGKWVQTYGNHVVESVEGQTTAVGRLKRDFDRQVKNILLLEKERNDLQCQVLVLQKQLLEAGTTSSTGKWGNSVAL